MTSHGFTSDTNKPLHTRFVDKINELRQYRYLLTNLVRRDLKVRYKNSVLGVVWSLLNPLLMMIVFSLVFTVAFGNGDIPNYPVFILVGLLPWNFFSGAFISGTTSITGNAGLIKKIYFPREILPTAAMLAHLVNFFFAFLILLLFLFISGIGITRYALWVPVLLITQIVFTLGLSFLLSSLNVFYRDVLMVLDVVMLAWFFLTPIVYSLESFDGKQMEILGYMIEPAAVMRWLNPMASIIDGYRTVLWGNLAGTGPGPMDLNYMARTFATAVLVFIVGYAVFLKTQPVFSERL